MFQTKPSSCKHTIKSILQYFSLNRINDCFTVGKHQQSQLNRNTQYLTDFKTLIGTIPYFPRDDSYVCHPMLIGSNDRGPRNSIRVNKTSLSTYRTIGQCLLQPVVKSENRFLTILIILGKIRARRNCGSLSCLLL